LHRLLQKTNTPNPTRRKEAKQEIKNKINKYKSQLQKKNVINGSLLRLRDGNNNQTTKPKIYRNETGSLLRLRGGNNNQATNPKTNRNEALIKMDKLIIQSQNVRSIYDENKQSIKRDSIVNHIFKESKDINPLAAFLLQETWISNHQQLRDWIKQSQLNEEYNIISEACSGCDDLKHTYRLLIKRQINQFI
jgi:hypothetical protein